MGEELLKCPLVRGPSSDFFIIRRGENVLLSYFGIDDIRTIGCGGIVSGLVTRYFGSCERAKWRISAANYSFHSPDVIEFIAQHWGRTKEGGRGGGGEGDVKFRRICSIQPFFSLCLNLNTYTGQ